MQSMSGLSSALQTNTASTHPWIFVTRRFSTLQRNLELRQGELDDCATKLSGVVGSLNRGFWGKTSLGHYFLAGSWGKNTAIRPPNDIDVFFLLPFDVYIQFNSRLGNGQSQLLQHVRDALADTYPQTHIRGDGQVVVVSFNSVDIEVIPAFHAQAGGFLICDTNGGGRWKRVDPYEEVAVLDRADTALNGNVRKLTRIIKQWKRHCNVPIKSFHIEQLVRETLAKLDYGGQSEFWFDWLVRDIFLHMYGRAGGEFCMPGTTNELITMSNDWQSKAQSAYERAAIACDYERQNSNIPAGTEWQKIFGPMVPEIVT
jgi:hypothetical protein